MTDESDQTSNQADVQTDPDRRARTLKDVVLADFARNGAGAVSTLRLERVHDYLKLVASLSSDAPSLGTPTVEDMTDDEFTRVLNAVRSFAAAGGSGPDRSSGA